jgi:hypothetical protein
MMAVLPAWAKAIHAHSCGFRAIADSHSDALRTAFR